MHALIATFYAYKGGTGRTLTLSNVARYLADELGYRVGLVDLDIESPGLVHEPLCAELEQSGQVSDDIRSAINRKKGFVDCFLQCAHDPDSAIGNIDDYVYALSSGRNGGILLMPAAFGSVRPEDDYNNNIDRFIGWLSDAGSVSVASKITWSILTKFIERYKLDFLFIDGRTGTGPFFPVYVYSVPSLLVLFSGLNDQNIKGSLSVLRAATNENLDPVPVFLVASPVPTVGPADFERRLAYITDQLRKERSDREKTPDTKYLYEVPQNVDYFLPYSDAASFGEVYFHGIYPHSNLADAHRNLALSIARLVVRRREESLEAAPVKVHQTVSVALEDVHADLPIVKPELIELNIRGYPNEEGNDAPWERLLRVNDDSAEIDKVLEEMPDVVAIPQTHLQAIAAKSNGKLDGALLYDLNDLRDKMDESSPQALDFNFLDLYYPNWRRWCSSKRSLAGLPFSVNAMLLCADADRLSIFCRLYWDERGQKPGNSFFLPSNWQTLIDLLCVGKQNDQDPNKIFRIVERGRGLYYDWLNLTASLGGFDLIQSEGRLLQGVTLDAPEAVEATKLFVELARLCGISPTMGSQIGAFERRQVAMYVGWTDSFRFKSTDGFLKVSVTLRNKGKASTGGRDKSQDIRLGYCPRDMRHPRKSLVDGWVMVFPRKRDPSHLPRALAFASRFLEPANQRRLLREGFPSPSAWAVEREMEVLKADRIAASARPITAADGELVAHQRAQQSFEVFLDTQKAAIHSGRWIASTQPPLDQDIADTLRQLIDREDMDIGAKLADLAESLRSKLGLPSRKGS